MRTGPSLPPSLRSVQREVERKFQRSPHVEHRPREITQHPAPKHPLFPKSAWMYFSEELVPLTLSSQRRQRILQPPSPLLSQSSQLATDQCRRESAGGQRDELFPSGEAEGRAQSCPTTHRQGAIGRALGWVSLAGCVRCVPHTPHVAVRAISRVNLALG